MKILLSNLGYCTGIDGSKIQYALKGHRYATNPIQIQDKVINGFMEIINKENPDICCLIEIQKNQFEKLANGTYPHGDATNKYGPGSKLNFLPFFNRKCNGFIAKQNYNHDKKYLVNGTKKLVYDIQLNDWLSLIFTHFSLKSKVRAKQFEEIGELVKDKQEAIVCGDFNTFNGLVELDSLLSKSGMRVINDEHTFPSFNPQRALDIFLCTPGVRATSRAIASNVSDHLPVVLEVKQ